MKPFLRLLQHYLAAAVGKGYPLGKPGPLHLMIVLVAIIPSSLRHCWLGTYPVWGNSLGMVLFAMLIASLVSISTAVRWAMLSSIVDVVFVLLWPFLDSDANLIFLVWEMAALFRLGRFAAVTNQ